MWIAALPGSVTEAARGYPVALQKSHLEVPPGLDALTAFLGKYVFPLNEDLVLDDPSWYLGSFWG